MSFNVEDLLTSMVTVAKDVFDKDWPIIKEHAETELKGIAEGIVLIERLRIEGKITQKQSKLLIKMKKNTAKIILLTIEGLGLVMVEKAINSAVKTLRNTVNKSLGFALL